MQADRRAESSTAPKDVPNRVFFFRPIGVAAAAALAVLLVPADLFAVSEGAPAIYAPLILESARASGMGNVTVIASDGPTAMRWNPGFLAFLEESEALVTTGDVVPFREDTHLRTVAVTGRVPTLGSLRAGLSFRRYSFGTIRFGLPSGGVTETPSFDHAYAAGLGLPMSSRVGVGLTLEYVWSHLSDPIPELLIDDGQAGAFSASIGMALKEVSTFESRRPDGSILTVTPLAGISLLHVGGTLEYQEKEQAADLARQLHAGLGIEFARKADSPLSLGDSRRLGLFEVTVGLETVFPAVEFSQISKERMILLFGADVSLFGLVSARVGFIDDDDGGIQDNTYGFGLGISEVGPLSVRVDWATFPWGGSERVDRWAMAFAWGPPAP